MALTKCTVAVDVIGSLGTDVAARGLTTQQFKDKFDQMPEGIETYLNDILTAETDIALAAKMPLAGGTYSGTVDHARNQVHQPQLQDYSEMLSVNAAATGAVTLDIVTGNVFDITLTGATTLTFSNPAPTGQACSFTLIVRQDATARAITWPAAVKWPSDTIPDISAVSKTSVFTFLTVNGGTRWYGFLAANGLVT
jgi:hypothetical protein